MRENGSWVVIACALAACGGQGGTSSNQQQPGSATAPGSAEVAEPVEAQKQEGEIPVVLGDCAPVTTPFISGPEPQGFKAEDLAKPPKTLFASMADGGDVAAAFDYLHHPDVGKFGTIGHGSGTGQAYGLGAGNGLVAAGGGTGAGFGYGGRVASRPSGCGPGMDGLEVRTPGGGTGICGHYISRPEAVVGELTVQPGVTGVTYDKAIVRRYIKRNIQKITYCYEKQLLAAPNLKGGMKATFVITPAGTVATANADGVSAEVSSCVAQVIMGIEFPKPSEGIVKVTLPMTFKPSDDEPQAPTPKAQIKAPPPPTPASVPYQAGASTPLAELRIGLTDCFRRQDKHAAALVFDLAPGKITATGIDSPAFTKCVEELGAQVKVATPTRCSATFGTAGVESLPAVDITADSVSFLGKPIVEAPDDGKKHVWWKLEALFNAATEDVKATLATKAALTIHGPIVVRPLPTASTRTVDQVVHTLIAAGEDPVLAAQRNGTWQLLRNYPLPVVPVPLGTGGSWSSDLARRAVLPVTDPLKIGLEKGGVFIDEKHVPFDKLADTLKALKADKRYVDRDDVWIQADSNSTPYSELVDVIDKVDAAGFRHWSLTSPAALNMKPL